MTFSQLLCYNVYVVGGDRMKKRQLKKSIKYPIILLKTIIDLILINSFDLGLIISFSIIILDGIIFLDEK